MGWNDADMPPIIKCSQSRQSYEVVADSLCPPVYQAYAAHMLWSMGKPLPPETVIEEASDAQLERRLNDCGVEHFHLHPLNEQPAMQPARVRNATKSRTTRCLCSSQGPNRQDH